MTDPSGFGSGRRLTFLLPLSEERADRLVADLAAARPATVTDFGCGWGELLLRVLQAAPQAHGTGVDLSGADVQRARRSAARLEGMAAGQQPRRGRGGTRQTRRAPFHLAPGSRGVMGYAYLMLGVPAQMLGVPTQA